jgi:heme oxygenase
MLALKQATRSAHHRIELALPFFDAGLTRARYIRVLQALYGFYAPVERLCELAVGPSEAPLELRTRRKIPLLDADLAVLGQPRRDLAALPSCRLLPTVTLASQALGVLYVLEGATLGGQIIARRLHELLGIDALGGAAFFASYGDRTREMWRRFAAQVERAPGFDLAAALGAAVQTFETLEGWLTVSLGSR